MALHKPHVVAAIPNYNMASGLEQLLPQVLGQEYDAVYVLDDASTDDSLDVARQFGSDVNIVRNPENRGAGATRNRMIEQVGHSTLIHFLDADMHLVSERTPELVREAADLPNLGFVGGLILGADGHQAALNYGPRQCLHTDIAANIHLPLVLLGKKYPLAAENMRGRLGQLLEDWPDPLKTPVERPVYWAGEANLIFQSDVFQKIGGFDPNIREHEIQDMAMRLHKKGLAGRFNPAIAAIHHALDVRFYNRPWKQMKAEWYIARKHGVRNWLAPDGKLRPEL